MTFAIDPAVLRDHASQLRTCQGTIPTARSYAQTHMSLEFVDTALLFMRARGAAHDLRDSARNYLTQLHRAIGTSATELDGTATRSIELDDAEEAILDAQYPGNPSGQLGIAPAAPNAATPPSPADALVAPTTSVPVDLASQILGTNWLSPSTYAAGLIEFIVWAASWGGVSWNPLEQIGQTFSGDWDRMYQVSSSIKALADHLDEHAAHQRHWMAVSAVSWEGEASTAANAFFEAEARALEEAASELRSAAPEFEAVARGMMGAGNIVSGFWAGLFDTALIAWGCFATAGGVAATGVGAPVGAVIAAICGTGSLGYIAWCALQIIQKIDDVVKLLDGLGVAIGLTMQFFAGPGGALPLPAGYDNAQVN